MNNIFDKPIIDQLFEHRKENFEQYTYDNNDEIRNIQVSISKKNEKILAFVKRHLANEENYKKFFNMFENYETKTSEELYFWSKEYYKLGMIDMNKLKSEMKCSKTDVDTYDIFLDFTESELDEYIKKRLDYSSNNIKAYKQKYDEIAKKYPNVLKVFEKSMPITLNIEEMKLLIELIKLNEKVRTEERKMCFKLGISEVLDF